MAALHGKNMGILDKITGLKKGEVADQVKEISYPLDNMKSLDPLMEKIGNARFVLLGEATHGTHEFYTWRTKISQRLIKEKGFGFIAVEGDWPQCYKLNRYVKGYPNSGLSARDVLEGFVRWPSWMWANWEVVALAEWLKAHNQTVGENKKVGFYGLDVYGLWESLEAIANYVEKHHPQALEATKKAIACFEPYGEDEGRDYARAAQFAPSSCRNEVVALLTEIRKSIEKYEGDSEAAFCAEQNALVAVNAEKFYRSMLSSNESSWNVRDHHMMETLNRLADFHGPDSKAIVWEHNTHVGDARATDMAEEGLVNIGQLARGHHNKDVFILGFGNYSGTVMAGDEWGAPMEEMEMPEAREGSWEWILHEAGEGDKLLFSDDLKEVDAIKNIDIPHRAVGVVYHPWLEKHGNYVPSRIAKRYNAFMFFENTKAVHPLHIQPDGHKTPLTYPWEV